MKKEIAVKLTKVSKKYLIHHEKPTLAERLIKGKSEEFWALRNMNLVVHSGETLGIIGANGSGKTTLLKIIAGITTPTLGEVETHGKIISLIDLEAGFHPDLSGIQNIFLNGMLIGMTKKEVVDKFNEIVNFSGVGKFIDAQLYTYSEGMKLRLGFSIAVFADPDIVVLDENISVGDREFCIASSKKLKELFAQGKTVIISSHDLSFIKQNCNRVILLKKGKIVQSGSPSNIIKLYDNE